MAAWGTNAVTTKLTFIPKSHPDEDLFENYALERLSEEKTIGFEEHLLICEECQSTLQETDEYIQFMKLGMAAQVTGNRGGAPHYAHVRGPGLRWNAARAAALLLTCLTALLSWRTPTVEPQTVELNSYRGMDVQVPSGRPLDLKIDLRDVAPAAGYRVEIVDATGHRVWFGGTPARVTKGLSPGVYWVRLSTDTGEPLREYGLSTGR